MAEPGADRQSSLPITRRSHDSVKQRPETRLPVALCRDDQRTLFDIEVEEVNDPDPS